MTKKSVAVLADESYHLLPNVDDDNYSNLYAEHFADLWSDNNRHEQRVTGGLPGLSLDD